MADDIANTLSELNVLFQDTILGILGFTQSGSPPAYDSLAYSAVRVSWPTDGAPAWKIDDDVVFLKTQEEEDLYSRPREILHTTTGSVTLNEATGYTRVIGLNLILYGPNSFSNAQLIRDEFYIDSNRIIFAKKNLYLIPDVVTPTRFPENFSGRWWERTDIDFKFNEKIIRNKGISIIESVEIGVHNKDGLISEIEVVTDE